MTRGFVLHGYWRSSASWRVRWALLLKNIPFEQITVNLRAHENLGTEHLAVNPTGLIPMLTTPDADRIVQSMAILQYLEDLYPAPALFGTNPVEGARIRALCEIINADTAPLQAPRVQKRFNPDPQAQALWSQEWIRHGLASFSKIRPGDTVFSAGDTISAADLFLVPQVYNAFRYRLDVASEFPGLMKIYEACLATPAGKISSPEQQPDALA